MPITPAVFLFQALTAVWPTGDEALLLKIAADNQLNVSTCKAFAAHAAAWRALLARGAGVEPLSYDEATAALSVLWAYPGVSAAEATIYRHVLKAQDMPRAIQQELAATLGDLCSMVPYHTLARRLVATAHQAGAPEDLRTEVREAIVYKALQDTQQPLTLLGLMTHASALQGLAHARLLNDPASAAVLDDIVAKAEAVAHATRATSADAFDLRGSLQRMEPVRLALLRFILAEVGIYDEAAQGEAAGG